MCFLLSEPIRRERLCFDRQFLLGLVEGHSAEVGQQMSPSHAESLKWTLGGGVKCPLHEKLLPTMCSLPLCLFGVVSSSFSFCKLFFASHRNSCLRLRCHGLHVHLFLPCLLPPAPRHRCRIVAATFWGSQVMKKPSGGQQTLQTLFFHHSLQGKHNGSLAAIELRQTQSFPQSWFIHTATVKNKKKIKEACCATAHMPR